MPSFPITQSVEDCGYSFEHTGCGKCEIWGSYLVDGDVVPSLWRRGYSFIVLGKDISELDGLEYGERITFMLVVLRDNVAIDPFADRDVRRALVRCDEYEVESPSMYARFSRWVRGDLEGSMDIYIHVPSSGSSIIPIEIPELVREFVFTSYGKIAPAMELDFRYECATSMGAVEMVRQCITERTCIKAQGKIFAVR